MLATGDGPSSLCLYGGILVPIHISVTFKHAVIERHIMSGVTVIT